MAGSGGFSLDNRTPSMILPTSQVELSVRCEKLCDMDVMSKSDPICVMFMRPRGARQPNTWVEVGRTEMIRDTLDPEFQKKFVVDYSFEERQVVKFEIYDWDNESNHLSAQDFLGRCEATLGTIVSSRGSLFASVLKDLPNNSKPSKIFITAEELEVNKELVTMQLSAEKLDKKDFFGKSDPFYIISKGGSNGKFVVVKKSEVIMKTLNPTWLPVSISVRDLCNNKYERPLKIEVYDWNSSGSHDIIGSFTTSLAELVVAVEEKKQFPVILEKKKGKKNYKNSGTVRLKNIEVTKQASFLDYIQGGTSMNFSVAVDFTASNGNPRDPRSLHYMAPGQDNQYITAIKSVGAIVEDYDTDKMFPALGFGARVPPTNQVSHEFFLNLRTDSPYCQGVDGLLAAYLTSLHSVTLYGPTNFAPVIKHVAKFAQSFLDGKQYFVLLIITDGIITDMDDTIYSIIDASRLPMSIIIVGVGNEDFSSMEALDSDDKLLQLNRVKAVRDIVQFVELRKFIGPGGAWDKELLAKDVLAEVPTQVTDWMKMNGIKPGIVEKK
jgi:hypothetical protein